MTGQGARTGAEALRMALPRLRDAGVPDAARDARLLLADAMGIGADRLTLHLHDDLAATAAARFETHIAARITRQPVAQILGRRDFFGRSFLVTPDTLDPRPDTERLVELALSRPFTRMLDLGTGTGCILISCLAGMVTAQGLGTDLSEAALDVARTNATRHGLGPRATFARADWFDGVPGRYDLITSNPPYIAADEMPGLDPEVRDHEPRLALTPGGDGLAAYRILSQGAGARLLPGGRLLLEIGHRQATAVSALLAGHGFVQIGVHTDLNGHDRVVSAEKPVDSRG